MILSVFFTKGISLQDWLVRGLFDREILIYEKILQRKKIKKIFLFTYGYQDDVLFKKINLSNSIYVFPPPFKLDSKFKRNIYSFLIPFIYYKKIKETQILKSNQFEGSWSTFIASMLTGRPYYLRSGYSKSFFIKSNEGYSIRFLIIYTLEFLLYCISNYIVVSSKRERKNLISRKINSKKIFVIPNFIDCEKFYPNNSGNEVIDNFFLFVGRFDKQKNIFQIIKGIHFSNTNFGIHFVGKFDPSEVIAIKNICEKFNVEFKFLGAINNDLMPSIYNKYKYFLQLSLFEGMPKTLIEAMACGCICIGTNVPGIIEFIDDNNTGFLTDGTSARHIGSTMKKVVNLNNLQKISKNATSYVMNNYSVEVIVNKYENLENKIFN